MGEWSHGAIAVHIIAVGTKHCEAALPLQEELPVPSEQKAGRAAHQYAQ